MRIALASLLLLTCSAAQAMQPSVSTTRADAHVLHARLATVRMHTLKLQQPDGMRHASIAQITRDIDAAAQTIQSMKLSSASQIAMGGITGRMRNAGRALHLDAGTGSRALTRTLSDFDRLFPLPDR